MAAIKGIDVQVIVGSGALLGSRDPLYIGVYGKKGGREFAFNLPPNTLNSPGQVARFRFGAGCCTSPADILIDPCGQLKLDDIDLDSVDYVYVRKLSRLMTGGNAGSTNIADDDKLELDKAVVTLCDSTGNMRRFRKTAPMFFAYECGLQHWLPETARPGCIITINFTSVDYTGHDIGNDIAYKLTAVLNGSTQIQDVPEHHFGPGWEPIYNRTIQYFFPGCCNFSGKLKLRADVTEVDWRIDDKGHEDEEFDIVCGQPPINFEINVDVEENNHANKTAHFKFHGTISSQCVG